MHFRCMIIILFKSCLPQEITLVPTRKTYMFTQGDDFLEKKKKTTFQTKNQ
jgi:hypothetical protein